MVTFAAGITAPCVSLTTPLIDARLDWADAQSALNMQRTRTRNLIGDSLAWVRFYIKVRTDGPAPSGTGPKMCFSADYGIFIVQWTERSITIDEISCCRGVAVACGFHLQCTFSHGSSPS